MTTQRKIHLTLSIRGVDFQHRTRSNEEHRQNLGTYRFLQFK
jgi:hypothetical protein